MSEFAPGSPEWELDVARRDYNMAGQLVHDAQRRLDEATRQLVDAALFYGKALAKADGESNA